VADLVYPPVIGAIKLFWKYLGLKFDFEGVENIPLEGGAVLSINHIGYLDFALTGTAALPAGRYVRFMAKKEIFDNKLAGPLMRGMHHICVDRSSGTASFVAALRALRSGEIIGIFPEGTISVSFEIKELKTGAVRWAMAYRLFQRLCGVRSESGRRRSSEIYVVINSPLRSPSVPLSTSISRAMSMRVRSYCEKL